MGRSPFLRRFENEGERDFALAKWAMEITNTLHLKDRKLTEISGGELQRVIVARALTQEPKNNFIGRAYFSFRYSTPIGIIGTLGKFKPNRRSYRHCCPP